MYDAHLVVVGKEQYQGFHDNQAPGLNPLTYPSVGPPGYGSSGVPNTEEGDIVILLVPLDSQNTIYRTHDKIVYLYINVPMQQES